MCIRDRVQIHANCRLRRIYFSDRVYSDEELPEEFKLFLPLQHNDDDGNATSDAAGAAAASADAESTTHAANFS